MIPDRSVSVYRLMQFTITVIRIHFELVGFHYGQLSSFHILFHEEAGDPIMR